MSGARTPHLNRVVGFYLVVNLLHQREVTRRSSSHFKPLDQRFHCDSLQKVQAEDQVHPKV